MRTTAVSRCGWKKILATFVLCSAAAVAAQAQTFTVLHTFMNGMDGGYPDAPLVEGFDGNLYGTTLHGGTGDGIVFKITPGGTLTTLHSFCPMGNNCPDGTSPRAGLAIGPYGTFWGTASGGGSGNGGTLFKITPEGALTTLYNFCSKTNCADGGVPTDGLLLGTDGSFYGTTQKGGTRASNGTAFKIGLGGVLRTLHTYCVQVGCVDGALPNAPLAQGTDGNF